MKGEIIDLVKLITRLIVVKTMKKIFEQLFQYGLQDTEISSIENEEFMIYLNFDKGIYNLDETGKEDTLTGPVKVCIKIESNFLDLVEDAFEIKEYSKKVKFIKYSLLKKYLNKGSFIILSVYYCNFNQSLLIDGILEHKKIIFSIEKIEKISIYGQNQIKRLPQMKKTFEQLSHYGFHDTEITSFDNEGLVVYLNFDEGIYNLDELGRESALTPPLTISIKVNSSFNYIDEAIEIKKYGRKMTYIDFSSFKNYLIKKSFGIMFDYYSIFNNSILFVGDCGEEEITISIKDIEEISIFEQN